jgi:hypothetical protein
LTVLPDQFVARSVELLALGEILGFGIVQFYKG